MTTGRPIDLDALTLDGVRAGALRDRPVTVLGLARSGIALARFLADAGARVTVYDGRPADELARRRSRRSATGAVTLRARAGRRPGDDLGRRRPRDDLALDHTRLPDDRAAPAGGARGARRGARGRRSGPRRRSSPRPTCSCASARRPTIGVTGTKGKTTTVVAGRARSSPPIPAHPVVLGGNIGIPLVERLPGADARPPRRRRAVGAPAADPVARHDRRRLHERHLRPPRPPRVARGATARVKRRLAELVDPDGALVLNAEDPVVAGVRRPRAAPGRPVPARAARRRAASASSTAGSWPPASSGCRWPAAGAAATGPGGRIMPVGRARHPRRPQRLQRPRRGRGRRCCSASRPTRSARAAAAFTGVEHRLEPVALVDGVRFVNDSQGTQPDAVDRRAARVRRRRSCSSPAAATRAST